MEQKDYRLAAVMFTDIVGFSRMMEDDERGTLKTLDFHDTLVREQVQKFRGTVIKTIGDAFLAQFQTTLDAVECSLAVQNGIGEYNGSGLGKKLTLRIGVHLGDIYFYENDALGEGINIASRLQSLTKPGHITISREVYSQVSGKIPMRVEAMGQVQLKNITREVHAYEIIPGGEDNNSHSARKAQTAEVVPPVEPKHETFRGSDFGAYHRPPSSPPPAFRDLRGEWQSLKSQIKEHMKEELAGGPGQWHHRRKDLRRQLRHGRWEAGGDVEKASQIVDQIFHDPLDELKTADGSPATAFEKYKQKKIRNAKSAGGGLLGHVIPYLSVNAFLAILYFTLTPGAHPWFLYPLFGWGVGLISHWSTVLAAKRSAWEVQQIDQANQEELEVIKQFQNGRGGFLAHLGSNLAVSALLVMIWSITWTGFPWPLFPIGGMAIGVFGHLSSYLSRRVAFLELWRNRKNLPKPASTPTLNTTKQTSNDPLLQRAQTLRDSIVNQAQGLKGENPFGDDMGTTLDNYVKQIGELSSIERELSSVVSSFRPNEMEEESLTLRGKIESTSSSTLKREYEKSLDELSRQQKSVSDLAEQQEILGLRLKSAVGNLQQMQVDLARIKGLSDGRGEGTFVAIKDRSEELSRYLEDYREGLKDLSD